MFTLGGLVPDGLHEEPVLGEHGRVVRDSWLQHQISANISSKGQVVCAKSIKCSALIWQPWPPARPVLAVLEGKATPGLE